MKWTSARIGELVTLWETEPDLRKIAEHFNLTMHSFHTLTKRLRKSGVHLSLRRKKKLNNKWSKKDVEFLVEQ